ncbi:MAG: hypothetical protein ACYC3X_08565 [Pirellulaceae bacterium]
MAIRRILLATAMVLALPAPGLPAPSLPAADDTQPLDIGTRRELFADQYLIDTLHDVRLVLHTPRDEGIVVKFDQPWEGPFCGYCTVIQDGPLYRLYYRGLPTSGRDGSAAEVCCYAESADGLHWTKPDLGLFELAGTTHNNVVLANAAPVTHNFCPLLDTRPGVPPEQRFKALGGTMESGLVAHVSPDGIHWQRLVEQPVLTKEMVAFPYMFDSQNLAFWSASESQYLCYFRVFHNDIRRICRTTSADFVHWSTPVLMEYRRRGGDVPLEHLYTNQTHPYFRAPHLYVAIAARFMPGRQVLTDAQAAAVGVDPQYFRDTSDAVFLTSRGEGWYDREFLTGFIRPGIGANNWVSRTNYPALNVVQTGPTEMSVYVNQDYAQPTAHLRRYSLRLDGFASAQADYAGGELLTRPLVFQGRELSLNFATSAAGGIRVELQRADGSPIPGFSRGDAVEQIGNEIQRVVSWTGGSDVSALAGQPIRICFVMHDADLFAVQFRAE